MRLLILGASGQVGAWLKQLEGSQARGTYFQHAGPGFSRIDLEDQASVDREFEAAKPEVAVLAAALSAVDFCEENPAKAGKINVEGTRRVVEACKRHGSRLVFLSTEYVFDGKRGPYAETDEPKPLNVYGRTKLEGEKLVLALGEKGLVVRSTVIYSYRPGSLNFVMQLIRRLSRKEKFIVPGDQVSNPTYAPDLAEAVLELVDRGASGVFHAVGPDRLSRYDFALKAVGILRLDPSHLERCATSELRQKAVRPLEAGLVTDKLRAAIGRDLVGIEEGVRRVREAWRRDAERSEA